MPARLGMPWWELGCQLALRRMPAGSWARVLGTALHGCGAGCARRSSLDKAGALPQEGNLLALLQEAEKQPGREAAGSLETLWKAEPSLRPYERF